MAVTGLALKKGAGFTRVFSWFFHGISLWFVVFAEMGLEAGFELRLGFWLCGRNRQFVGI